MTKKLIPLAISYDFDGTLAPGNMQEHSFLPEIGKTPTVFWPEVKALARKQDMDEILAYMTLMLKYAKAKDQSIKKEAFIRHGKNLNFFTGVNKWFGRINAYGKTKGVKVEHYIISSGLRELVEGTPIAKEFRYIFASGFMYNTDGIAEWPALAVNYTNKTQYLFRINKGIHNSYDNTAINKYLPEDERPVPFTNMVYIGDGETDIPSMKMVKYQGGYAIAVYDPKKRKTKSHPSSKDLAHRLLEENRADYAVPTDYNAGKPLDEIMKAIIDRVANASTLKSLKKK
ncbi:MAG: haloacid dehalogenase-like hydrolase [Aliivibrio sp.]|uniref:HAD family hydrolase n=1 Tax=Aliivibrio sp. TaxID=1872443 RepID=UPI001A5B1961|nr:haloacid dehalogenase-like hydrolase [Aliivibrio sp.]